MCNSSLLAETIGPESASVSRLNVIRPMSWTPGGFQVEVHNPLIVPTEWTDSYKAIHPTPQTPTTGGETPRNDPAKSAL